VHLIHSEKSCFGNIVLNERKSFVFIGEVIKRKVNAPHWAERQERLFHGVLANVEVYAADINSTIKLNDINLSRAHSS